MIRKIMNKKGEERYLSVWMIIVWVIVALASFIGLYLFYSAQSDVRDIQDKTLINRAVGCVVEDGKINSLFLEKDFDFYNYCKLSYVNFDKGYFYLNLTLRDFYSKAVIKKVIVGSPDFDMQCFLSKKSKGNNFPVCKDEKVIVNYNDGSSAPRLAVLEIQSAAKLPGSKL